MFKPNISLPGIKIWDNLLDDRFLLDLDEESNHYNWRLGNIANRKSYPLGTKGSHLLWGTTLYDKLIQSPTPTPLPSNIKDLYSHLAKWVTGQNFLLTKIEINGQSMGQDGTCHIDSLPNLQTHTLMVFINYKWEEKWGGDFQILKELNDNAEVIHSIKYISGRVILFEGNIPHRGLSPLVPNILRKSLIFRLKKI